MSKNPFIPGNGSQLLGAPEGRAHLTGCNVSTFAGESSEGGANRLRQARAIPYRSAIGARMRRLVSVLVLAILLAEITGFVLVGQRLGVLATLGLILVSMLLGAALLRRQGIGVLARIRADLAAGVAPAEPLAEGAMVAVAAVLMIVPGFITDLAGIVLFIPAVRRAIWAALRRRVAFQTVHASFHRPATGAVVELETGEYAAIPRPASPWRRDDAR
jgi:UPF0716 protein FxsA